MKKLLKRIFPVMMALSMMFSLSVTALAAETDDASYEGVEVTESQTITENQTQIIIVAAAGIKVSIQGAKLVGLVVDPKAEGAEITVSGASDVAMVVVLAPQVNLTADEETVLGDISVGTPDVTLSVAGTAGNITLDENAAGANVTLAETAKVTALNVAAADVKAQVQGTVETVELAETATGFSLDASASAAVGTVTAPESVKESMEITGEGAANVPEASTPAQPETPSTTVPDTTTPDPVVPGGGDEEDDPPVTTPDPVKIQNVSLRPQTVPDGTTSDGMDHYLTIEYTFDKENGTVTGYTIVWTRPIKINGANGELVDSIQTLQREVTLNSHTESANSNSNSMVYIHEIMLEDTTESRFYDVEHPDVILDPFEDFSGDYDIVMHYQPNGEDEPLVKSGNFPVSYNDPIPAVVHGNKVCMKNVNVENTTSASTLIVTYTLDVEGNPEDYYLKWDVNFTPVGGDGTESYAVSGSFNDQPTSPELTLGQNDLKIVLNNDQWTSTADGSKGGSWDTLFGTYNISMGLEKFVPTGEDGVLGGEPVSEDRVTAEYKEAEEGSEKGPTVVFSHNTAVTTENQEDAPDQDANSNQETIPSQTDLNQENNSSQDDLSQENNPGQVDPGQDNNTNQNDVAA